MSIRVDLSPLIAGSVVVGVPGLGTIGSLIPATGEHGPGYAYDDLIAGDDTKEIRGLIVTAPTNGTLTAFEDTSFEYDGTSDTFSYQLYVDGVARGSVVTHTISIGETTSGTLTATGTDSASSLSGSIGSSVGTLTATGIDSAATLSGLVAFRGALAAVGTNAAASLTGTVTVTDGSLISTGTDSTANLTGQIVARGALIASGFNASATLAGTVDTGEDDALGPLIAIGTDSAAALAGVITSRGRLDAVGQDALATLIAAGALPVLAARRGGYRNTQMAARPRTQHTTSRPANIQ